MNLQERIGIMHYLGDYLKKNPADWQEIKFRAIQENPWFTEEFITRATNRIIDHYLTLDAMNSLAGSYPISDQQTNKKVGIIMAGNIPMVGFHDLLLCFLSGHRQHIKFSSKDTVLTEYICNKLAEWDPETTQYIIPSDRLNGCDAYIATGSSNSSRYFEQYFSAYPHIIRKNRTSIAILDGIESTEDLEKLSDDIHEYFGLGCRNVTKIYVPEGYDFVPLLASFNRYKYFADHQKYKNNYDYQLSILLLNHQYYMTNGTTLLAENSSAFSAISVLHYNFYQPGELPHSFTADDEQIQCRIGKGFMGFGEAQCPGITTYADGVDTLSFLVSL